MPAMQGRAGHGKDKGKRNRTKDEKNERTKAQATFTPSHSSRVPGPCLNPSRGSYEILDPQWVYSVW